MVHSTADTSSWGSPLLAHEKAVANNNNTVITLPKQVNVIALSPLQVNQFGNPCCYIHSLIGIAVRWVVDAIGGWHIFDQKWINALKAPHIYTELMWMRSPLMMRVNSTIATKMVFCLFAVELIQL